MSKKVKICGITNLQDALCAVEFGADALGFVFYEKSPRYIEPKIAKQIIDKLPPFVQKVGLFVNTQASQINEICKITNITLVQIHFDGDKNLYDNLEIPHIKVIRATCKKDLEKYADEYRLVDAFVGSFGGAGKRVEVSWFKGIDCSHIILAGGLNSENLDEVKKYNFYGFDVSSGVEREKRKKDKQKMQTFINKAKN
ncbi:MAG: phosphoribosylanthranilate isomerase [Campylobacteraceae bacterium]|nr:phosphoribosylanthranilate isomerase [Campylobacteraceae bacterium]